jgi:hypothetical protein
VTAIQEKGGLAVRRRQLEPAGGGHISCLDLGDHAGERTVPERVLGHGEDVHVLATLRVEELSRAQADLFKARRVEIERCDRPEYVEAGLVGETGGYSRREKGRRCVIVQACRGGGNFMEGARIETMVSKPIVDRSEAEAERRPARLARGRQLGAKRGEHLGRRPRQGGWLCGHVSASTRMFPLCSDESCQFVKRLAMTGSSERQG